MSVAECFCSATPYRKTGERLSSDPSANNCPEGRIVGIIGGDLKRVSESIDAVIYSTDKADALLDAVVGGERRRQKAG
jgi:hypothetical protein